MDPRYRAVLVISLLVIFLWAVHVAWTVLLGTGLDPHLYIRGVAIVGGSTLFGFCVVWSAVALGNLSATLKTGFEADVTDEFGTGFSMMGPDGKTIPFKLALSKFLPQMVAPPSWPGLHPLEAELLGFLQGYRNWPVDLATQNPRKQASGGKEFVSLYEQGIARWQLMRHLQGAGVWHRVIALARDLALVHAYREIRTTHPLKHFWKRDEVKFVARSVPHGGIAAFVLSTFPAFRALKDTPEGEAIQRALLVALRYRETPNLLPLNSGPLARELVDYLWRADAQLQQMDAREVDQVSPDQIEDLEANIRQQWLGVLDELEPQAVLEDSTTCLKLQDGSVWVLQNDLLARLAAKLQPSLRNAMSLWEPANMTLQHPAWPRISHILQEDGLIASEHDGQMTGHGCFTLLAGTRPWGPAIKIKLNVDKHMSIVRAWQPLPALEQTPEVVMDDRQLAAHAQASAGQLDAQLSELF